MKKNLIYTLFILLFSVSMVFPKQVTLERVEDIRLDMVQKKKKSALIKLISIYKDRNQPYDIRLEALRALAESRHPSVIEAMQEAISDASMIELDIMLESIDMLATFGVSKSSPAFVNGLKTTESKIMAIREAIISAIGENGTEDELMTLLELYEISKNNYSRMDRLLSLRLGSMDDDRAIPILMDIANNDEIDAKVRNRAIEILSRKDAPELVDFFVSMLGSPNSNDAMLDFVSNTMKLEDQDRMVMALLESYQAGKTRYHAILYSIMDSLEDYKNPQMKPLFVEVAKTEGYPRLLRIKAIQSLSNFGDEKVLDNLIPMLYEPGNYQFYYELKQ